jgi:hypothetical protein
VAFEIRTERNAPINVRLKRAWIFECHRRIAMVTKSPLIQACAAASLLLLAAGAACAQSSSSDPLSTRPYARKSTIDALGVSNHSIYSEPEFRASPNPSDLPGYSGSSTPDGGGAPFTGTENYPPGANGPEAPGAPGSATIGQAAD